VRRRLDPIPPLRTPSGLAACVIPEGTCIDIETECGRLTIYEAEQLLRWLTQALRCPAMPPKPVRATAERGHGLQDHTGGDR
jgi:hypothetical protein